MSNPEVAIVGARSMVGSVLRERMLEESDFAAINASYGSTSQAGEIGPDGGQLFDAYNLATLSDFDAIVSTQGSAYTKEVHQDLREGGWQGYWIDAASHLRLTDDAVAVLDPVNRHIINQRLDEGRKDLIGANCTVSTLLMGLTPLFRDGHVEWVRDDTYQAASGAGARHMKELVAQMGQLGSKVGELALTPASDILAFDRQVQAELLSDGFPVDQWGVPLAGNTIPWIDSAMPGGETREEWKGQVETNDILGLVAPNQIVVDSLCVRVGAMRSHAHALTIELKRDIPLDEIEAMVAMDHEWVKLVPNEEEPTKQDLTSVSASGDLKIHVGRLRKMNKGPRFLSAYVVGDQLLWGAAEPLRRALRIALDIS